MCWIGRWYKKNLNNNIKFFKVNLEINYNIFNAAYEQGIKNIINLGSSCMYPKNITQKCQRNALEQEKWKTNYGYALAKIPLLNYLKLLETLMII